MQWRVIEMGVLWRWKEHIHFGYVVGIMNLILCHEISRWVYLHTLYDNNCISPLGN